MYLLLVCSGISSNRQSQGPISDPKILREFYEGITHTNKNRLQDKESKLNSIILSNEGVKVYIDR